MKRLDRLIVVVLSFLVLGLGNALRCDPASRAVFVPDYEDAFQGSKEISVFVTEFGRRYHKEGCGYLSEGARAVSIEDAVSLGLTPCKVCKPGILPPDAGLPDRISDKYYELPAGDSLLPADLLRVIDGDTFEARVGEARVKVRLIGIDTPELRDRITGEPEPLAEEAKERLRSLLDGNGLFLELDAQSHDKYGRLLAYAWAQDAKGEWTFLNAHLLQVGLAVPMTIPPNVKHAQYLLQAYRRGRR